MTRKSPVNVGERGGVELWYVTLTKKVKSDRKQFWLMEN